MSNLVCVVVGRPCEWMGDFNGVVSLDTFTITEEYLAAKDIVLTAPCTRVSITLKNTVSSKYANLTRSFYRYRELGWGKKFFNTAPGPIGKILLIQNHRGDACTYWNDGWEFCGGKKLKRKRNEEKVEEKDKIYFPAPEELYFKANEEEESLLGLCIALKRSDGGGLRDEDEDNLRDENTLRGLCEEETERVAAKKAGEWEDGVAGDMSAKHDSSDEESDSELDDDEENYSKAPLSVWDKFINMNRIKTLNMTPVNYVMYCMKNVNGNRDVCKPVMFRKLSDLSPYWMQIEYSSVKCSLVWQLLPPQDPPFKPDEGEGELWH